MYCKRDFNRHYHLKNYKRPYQIQLTSHSNSYMKDYIIQGQKILFKRHLLYIIYVMRPLRIKSTLKNYQILYMRNYIKFECLFLHYYLLPQRNSSSSNCLLSNLDLILDLKYLKVSRLSRKHRPFSEFPILFFKVPFQVLLCQFSN